MMFSLFNKEKAGVEISSDQIRTASVIEKDSHYLIKHISDVKILPGILKPSFKIKNILNDKAFEDCLTKSLKDLPSKRITLSLPDAAIKVFIKKFKETPKDPAEIQEMVSWSTANSFNLPAEDLRISYENMGVNSENSHVFLIALGLEEVIAQYETCFKHIGKVPVVISPAGLNQFNFYSNLIPESGTIAYLGLFDDFLNIFVFSHGLPVFYKLIKKGLSGNEDESAVNDVDLLIQYYNLENPDLEIEKFYVASNIKSDMLIAHILQDFSHVSSNIDSDMVTEHLLQEGKNIEFSILDETKLIDFNEKFKLYFKNNPLPFYTSVLGAAKGF